MNDAPESGLQAAGPPLPPPAVPPSPRRSTVLPVLIGLLALGATGVLGLQFLQQRSALASLESALQLQQEQVRSSSERVAALQQQDQQGAATLQQQWQQTEAALKQELASASTRLAAQDEQLARLERDLATTNRRVGARDPAIGNQQVLLAEAEALLRLARERLLIAGDTGTAISLFNSADTLLQQSNDSAALGVRNVLAQELASLQALPAVDVQGLYLQLGTLAAAIDGFALQSASSSGFAVDAPVQQAPAEGWYADLGNALARYFVITRPETAIQPLLSTEQQYLLRRGIQLRIEQARLALLRGQTDIWRSALIEAGAEVARWLVEDANGSRARLQQDLQQLRDTPITIAIPPLDGTLHALQQVRQAGGATP